jgi:hypothetical protein
MSLCSIEGFLVDGQLIANIHDDICLPCRFLHERLHIADDDPSLGNIDRVLFQHNLLFGIRFDEGIVVIFSSCE